MHDSEQQPAEQVQPVQEGMLLWKWWWGGGAEYLLVVMVRGCGCGAREASTAAGKFSSPALQQT